MKPADNVVFMIEFISIFDVGEITINYNSLYIDNADNIQENLDKDQPFAELSILINDLSLLRTSFILL